MDVMVSNTEVVFPEPQVQNEHNRSEAEAKRNFICTILRMRYV